MDCSVELADRPRCFLLPQSQTSVQIQQPELAHCIGKRTGDVLIDLEGQAASSLDKVLPRRRTVSRMKYRLLNIKTPGLFTSAEDLVNDGRYDRIENFRLESYTRGYSQAAAFIGSDVDNMIVPGFLDLHLKSLLYKAAELSKLSKRLSDLDREDAGGEDRWKVHSYPNLEDDEVRTRLVDEIDAKMKTYDDLRLRTQQLHALKRPTTDQYMSWLNFFINEHPLSKADQEFIYKKYDLVYLTQHAEFGWFDKLLHRLVNGSVLQKLLMTKEDAAKTTNPYIHYYSRSRLGTVVSTLIAFLSTMLLLTPVYILITIPMSMAWMATLVLGFVFLFAASVSIFTTARRYEVFAATAAYCAVLVVFLGNLQQIKSQSEIHK